jgi:hypothetical protein
MSGSRPAPSSPPLTPAWEGASRPCWGVIAADWEVLRAWAIADMGRSVREVSAILAE